MKLSIAKKIVALTTGAVIVAATITFWISYFLFDKLLAQFEDEKVASVQQIIERMKETDRQKILQSAKMLSVTPELIAALSAGEADEIKIVARRIRDQWGFDAVTITDAKGIVVARGHSDRTGDDISKRSTIIAATQGRFEAGILYDPSAVVPFTIRCDVPVYQNNTLVGILSLATSLGTETHIDSIHELIGMQFTLFGGDTRIMTSVRSQDGKRIIGTRMEDAEILERVLKRGETVIRHVTLTGIPYDAVYWPIKDLNGNNIVGMWFVGDDLTGQLAAQRRILMIVVVCSTIIALLIALLASFIGGKIARPVRQVADYASLVADGNLDAPLTVQSHDEVGLLIGALQRMVRTLKERISEAETVSAQAREQGAGGAGS